MVMIEIRRVASLDCVSTARATATGGNGGLLTKPHRYAEFVEQAFALALATFTPLKLPCQRN